MSNYFDRLLLLLGRIAVFYVRRCGLIVTDRVAWSVTVVKHEKMAELIEMPFGLWVRIGPENHVLDGSPET